MGPSPLLEWLASVAPPLRDAAIEDHLGIAEPASDVAPGEHLIGYHASGVAPIVRMLVDVPVGADDVVVDLGAGLGKVVLLARLLTGASARGIELQPALVARARAAAAARSVAVTFEEGDARTAALDAGTVFFLYVPFTGPVLAEVLRRLRGVAEAHAIVVCALGMDLDEEAPWLSRRTSDSFWLTIYDSVVEGVGARARSCRALVAADSTVEAVASERPLASCLHP
jgi:SAM-dependent methyltransferase